VHPGDMEYNDCGYDIQAPMDSMYYTDGYAEYQPNDYRMPSPASRHVVASPSKIPTDRGLQSMQPPVLNPQPFCGIGETSPLGVQRVANATLQTEHTGFVYKVQFKMFQNYFLLGNFAQVNTNIGDLVLVEADRGEDIGMVSEIIPSNVFSSASVSGKKNKFPPMETLRHILRLATKLECQKLPKKQSDEQNVVEYCQHLCANTYKFNMTVLNAEYQFDRHTLTIYYLSPQRIDFRKLCRDLFSKYKARIWMRKVSSPGLQQPFLPKQ